ncbi:MAG TPA: hypothetical protein VFG22_11455 [Polyangiales bacterium]|nr:hypothetical protein [Polyangiales bacterium]
MSGVEYAGTLGSATLLPPSAPSLDFYPGTGENNSGIPPVFNQWVQDAPNRAPAVSSQIPAFTAGGTITADTEGTPASPGAATEYPASSRFDSASFNAQDWFEAVHILPRTKIDFGNIITQVDETYEIYSAFRFATTVTESAITNNASPGVTLPDNTPTVDVPPLTSILDPTTSGQTTLGLGTIVLAKVRASASGVPTFDTDIIFEFDPPGNDVTLLVTGSRIVLLPFEYEVGAVETLSFLTDIITSVSGAEQRISARKQPRQGFQVEYALVEEERQAMHTILFDWQAGIFGFPVWHERVTLTAATSVGATSYPVSGADDVDFRVGGSAVVISDYLTYDVIEVSAQTDTLVSATSTAVNAYAAGTAIMPLRIARIPFRIDAERLLSQENFKISFEVTDNDTGALAGDTTPGFWSTYNSRVLFDDCNVIDRAGSPTKLSKRVYVVDNETGLVDQSFSWAQNKRESQKGFVARDRAEILALRKLFIALRGKAVSLYLPTFINELTPNATLASGTDTMDIASIGYTRFAQDRLPMALFRITFTDGTQLVREVASSAIVTTATERLTLNTTWPSTKLVSEVSRIEWYELVRFDSDVMRLTYPRIGLATCTMPVIRVFDDN